MLPLLLGKVRGMLDLSLVDECYRYYWGKSRNVTAIIRESQRNVRPTTCKACMVNVTAIIRESQRNVRPTTGEDVLMFPLS